MGIKEIQTKDFINYIQSLGLTEIRSKGSHTVFNYPAKDPRRLTRPIVVRMAYKTIPLLHLHTNLQTLGKSKDEFIAWLRGQD